MRKFIIDTDTASDDANAIMLALLCGEVEVLGITCVAGNVELDKTVKNALMTVEVCKKDIPVYRGIAKPLFRELFIAANVHGEDGMGDVGLIHPTSSQADGHAVDFILDTVRKNPGEIEIVTLGPVTNIAAAMFMDGETMRKVKRIWSMGTSGFGAGNVTPVAEFNVHVDAESYCAMLAGGAPITIAGLDLCKGASALTVDELSLLSRSGSAAAFAAACCTAAVNFNERRFGTRVAELPDAVAMGVALWDDIVTESVDLCCYCCSKEEATYGQVVFYPDGDANATVVKSIDSALFKKRLIDTLMSF